MGAFRGAPETGRYAFEYDNDEKQYKLKGRLKIKGVLFS
jgi:hypothetical protein